MKDTVPRPHGYVLNQTLKAVCDRAAEAGRVCLCVCRQDGDREGTLPLLYVPVSAV